MSTINRGHNLFPFPIHSNNSFVPQRQDGTEPFNFTNNLLKEQKKPDSRPKMEQGTDTTGTPVDMEEESPTLNETSSEIITPSPMNTEDEEDVAGMMEIFLLQRI